MKLIINPHSIVDIITNSSSEIFICNSKKQLEIVKSILQSLIDEQNSINNTKMTFENVFREPYIVNSSNSDSLIDTISSYGYQFSGTEYLPSYFDLEGNWEERNKQHEEIVNKWKENNLDKINGLLIIESASDNSIPYEIFDKINEIFNGDNVHLG